MRIDNENKVVWCSEQLVDWRNSFSRFYDPVLHMMYQLSRACFGWSLTDAEDNSVDYDFWDNTQKKELMLAILEDYEFKLEEQKCYWRKKEEYSVWFEVVQDTYLAQDEDDGELTLGLLDGAGWKCKFTETEARDLLKDDFDKFEKVECE